MVKMLPTSFIISCRLSLKSPGSQTSRGFFVPPSLLFHRQVAELRHRGVDLFVGGASACCLLRLLLLPVGVTRDLLAGLENRLLLFRSDVGINLFVLFGEFVALIGFIPRFVLDYHRAEHGVLGAANGAGYYRQPCFPSLFYLVQP